MIFNHTEELDKLINKLEKSQEQNLDYLFSLIDYLNDPFIIYDEDEDGKHPINYQEQYLNNLIPHFKEYDGNNLLTYYKNNLKYLDIKEFINNPYLELLNNISFDDHDWKLEKKIIKKGEIFIYGENSHYSENYRIHNALGYFHRDYVYPSISLCSREWMSLSPHEIKTMSTAVTLISGKVLILGLGLGYMVYMLSNKEDVKEIDVVEMDVELINLFKERILPKFPHHEKIRIIKADAFSYIKRISDYDYRYIFSDLWHDYSDGLEMYIKLKQSFQNFKYTHALYWIENSIITHLRMLFIRVIIDEYRNNIESDYDIIQLELKRLTSKMKVKNVFDLYALLNYGFLSHIILQINVQ